MNKQTVVISGINLYTGGTLKVMRECIEAVSAYGGDRFRIIALVHNEDLYPIYHNVEYIAYPASRKSWFIRLYYEYWGFRKLSQKLDPAYWISMHDTTPNVKAGKRIVYCHNPFPFYRPGWKNFHLQLPIFLLSLFSRYIYKVNIKKNDWVIVQQEWIRQAFKEMFGIDHIVVALPVKQKETKDSDKSSNKTIEKENERTGNAIRVKESKKTGKTVFFFPAGPMIHKNFEVLCRATDLLAKQRKTDDFKVIITLDGTENRYARHLFKKYGKVKGLHFSGYLSQSEMEQAYITSGCLVFPAKIETWGLPVTEAKEREIPILVSNLPWAKETVGEYNRVRFFNPDDSRQLCALMNDFLDNNITWDESREIKHNKPISGNWNEFLELIFENEEEFKN